jgi:hypothetical protein
MPLVSEEEVKTLARSMRLPRKRDPLVLFQQVEWRLSKRVMILKWVRLPSDVVRYLLSFVGNESECESRKVEKKEKYARSINLSVFRIESNWWVTLIHQQAHPRIIEACKTRLLEMGAKLKKHPKFPWEE